MHVRLLGLARGAAALSLVVATMTLGGGTDVAQAQDHHGHHNGGGNGGNGGNGGDGNGGNSGQHNGVTQNSAVNDHSNESVAAQNDVHVSTTQTATSGIFGTSSNDSSVAVSIENETGEVEISTTTIGP